MNDLQQEPQAPQLHCPTRFCDAPVTQILREDEVLPELELGDELDCGNETHAHYACGTLVRLRDNRQAYQMPTEQKREYEALKHEVDARFNP